MDKLTFNCGYLVICRISKIKPILPDLTALFTSRMLGDPRPPFSFRMELRSERNELNDAMEFASSVSCDDSLGFWFIEKRM